MYVHGKADDEQRKMKFGRTEKKHTNNQKLNEPEEKQRWKRYEKEEAYNFGLFSLFALTSSHQISI